MFQIHSKCSLTEPYVAHVIGEALYGDAIMFVGNSMVIRDLDMFGKGWLDHTTDGSNVMMHHFPDFLGTIVAGNRGASGIDGLLSTAIGFAVGSNKHVSNFFSSHTSIKTPWASYVWSWFCEIWKAEMHLLHLPWGCRVNQKRNARETINIIVNNSSQSILIS